MKVVYKDKSIIARLGRRIEDSRALLHEIQQINLTDAEWKAFCKERGVSDEGTSQDYQGIKIVRK